MGTAADEQLQDGPLPWWKQTLQDWVRYSIQFTLHVAESCLLIVKTILPAIGGGGNPTTIGDHNNNQRRAHQD